MYDSRPTFAEIDLKALRHNFQVVRTSIPRKAEILAVVKADAYGHGFMDISHELETLGVNAFGVAFLAEGIQLRKSGIDRPILLLGGVYPRSRNASVSVSTSPLSSSAWSRPRPSTMPRASSSARPRYTSRSTPAWDAWGSSTPMRPPSYRS